MRVRCLFAPWVCALAVAAPSWVSPSPAAATSDPPFSVPQPQLAAGLACPARFHHPEHEPVLLVHGTFTKGEEQFSWNYSLLLADRGFDSCVVTYPDRGLGDMQVSAEYVVYAIHTIYARTGHKVGMVGHSQGGLMPRWAIKWWPSVQAEVADFVMLASPNHGVGYAAGAGQSPFPLPAAFFQFDPNSHFIAALNAGDETPGAVDFSSIYSTLHDEAVQPDGPDPTAGLDWGHSGPHVRNLAVQEACPARLVDHVTIGTTDRLTQELVLDALVNDGPVDPRRVKLDPLCAVPDQYAAPAQVPALVEQFGRSMSGGFPDLHLVPKEPDLAPYTRPSQVEGAKIAAPSAAPAPAPAPGPSAGTAARSLPTTGGRLYLGWEALAVAAGLVLGLLRRAAERR
jgi:hypothetical protein